MKKPTQPKKRTRSRQAPQLTPDVTFRPPEVSRQEIYVPSPSALSSVPSGPLTSAVGVPVPDASENLAPESGRVGDWRNHPFVFWFGIVGIVASIFSIPLGIYFYQKGQIKPLLTFGVHPLKTELQRPDYDKDLGFTYKGKLLDSESITAVQVSVWNAGTRSIRDSDVLDPFRLVMPDGSAILSIRTKRTSRAICDFGILGTPEDYKLGTCRLKWRILEPGDGAVLQIIYAGSARHDPKLAGVLEGQPNGVVVESYNLGVNGTVVQDSHIQMSRVLLSLVLLSIAVLFLVAPMRIHAKREPVRKWSEEWNAAAKHMSELQKRAVPAPPWMWIAFVFGIFLVVAALVLLLVARPGPPFGW